MSGFI